MTVTLGATKIILAADESFGNPFLDKTLECPAQSKKENNFLLTTRMILF